MTKFGWYTIGKTTTLQSNKSLKYFICHYNLTRATTWPSRSK